MARVRARLHLTGLTPEVKEAEIRRKFESFGEIAAVDIIREKEGDPDPSRRPCRGFAYVDIVATSDDALEQCFRTFKRTRWRGRTFCVAPAKRDYMAWLQSEWKEARESNDLARGFIRDEPVPSAPSPMRALPGDVSDASTSSGDDIEDTATGKVRPAPRARFFALRHGQSMANVAKIISSDPKISTREHGLSALGCRQAKAAGVTFAELVADAEEEAEDEGADGVQVHIIASDFTRARETAQYVSQYLTETGIEHRFDIDVRLRERGFGDLNGKSNKNYQKVWDLDVKDASHTAFGVECVTSVLRRTAGLVEELDLRVTREAVKDGRDIRCLVLLVAHGDTLQILQTAFSGCDPCHHRSLPHLETGAVRELEIGGGTGWGGYFADLPIPTQVSDAVSDNEEEEEDDDDDDDDDEEEEEEEEEESDQQDDDDPFALAQSQPKKDTLDLVVNRDAADREAAKCCVEKSPAESSSGQPRRRRIIMRRKSAQIGQMPQELLDEWSDLDEKVNGPRVNEPRVEQGVQAPRVESLNKEPLLTNLTESTRAKDGAIPEESTLMSTKRLRLDEFMGGETDSESDAGDAFRIRPHFESKQGHKLLQLQRTFKGDERFRLDDRFIDDDDDDDDDDNDGDDETQPFGQGNLKNKTGSHNASDKVSKGIQQENAKALDILDCVVRAPRHVREAKRTRRVSDTAAGTAMGQTVWKPVKRFDPTRAVTQKPEQMGPLAAQLKKETMMMRKQAARAKKRKREPKQIKKSTMNSVIESDTAQDTADMSQNTAIPNATKASDAEASWTKSAWDDVMTNESSFKLSDVAKENTGFRFFPTNENDGESEQGSQADVHDAMPDTESQEPGSFWADGEGAGGTEGATSEESKADLRRIDPSRRDRRPGRKLHHRPAFSANAFTRGAHAEQSWESARSKMTEDFRSQMRRASSRRRGRKRR